LSKDRGGGKEFLLIGLVTEHVRGGHYAERRRKIRTAHDGFEEKLEYQEYTMEKLNEVILSQQNQLDKLEENLVLLREKLATTLHRDDRLGE
jgi:uncharacterized coiled-coil protein SlyX